MIALLVPMHFDLIGQVRVRVCVCVCVRVFGLYIDKPWFIYRYTYTKIESLALSLPIRDFIVESN